MYCTFQGYHSRLHTEGSQKIQSRNGKQEMQLTNVLITLKILRIVQNLPITLDAPQEVSESSFPL